VVLQPEPLLLAFPLVIEPVFRQLLRQQVSPQDEQQVSQQGGPPVLQLQLLAFLMKTAEEPPPELRF
jgi:hypothetical protein